MYVPEGYKEITQCDENGRSCVKTVIPAEALAEMKNANKAADEATFPTEDYQAKGATVWNGRDVKPGDKWSEKWTEDFENGEASEETVEFMTDPEGLDMEDIKERKEINERIKIETDNEDLTCRGDCADQQSADWLEERSFTMAHRRPGWGEAYPIPVWVGPDHPAKKGRDCRTVCCAKKAQPIHELTDAQKKELKRKGIKYTENPIPISAVPNFNGPVCSGVKPTIIPAAKPEDENGNDSGGEGGSLGVDDPAGPASDEFSPDQATDENSMSLNDMHPDWRGHPDLSTAGDYPDEPLFVTAEQKEKYSNPPDPDDLAKPACLERGGYPRRTKDNTNTCNGNYTVDKRNGNCAIYVDGKKKKVGQTSGTGRDGTGQSDSMWPFDSSTGSPEGVDDLRKTNKPYEPWNWPTK